MEDTHRDTENENLVATTKDSLVRKVEVSSEEHPGDKETFKKLTINGMTTAIIHYKISTALPYATDEEMVQAANEKSRQRYIEALDLAATTDDPLRAIHLYESAEYSTTHLRTEDMIETLNHVRESFKESD